MFCYEQYSLARLLSSQSQLCLLVVEVIRVPMGPLCTQVVSMEDFLRLVRLCVRLEFETRVFS